MLVGLIEVSLLERLSDLEKGWLSGIIDGEGSIRLRKRKDANTYKPSIAVTNTSQELLEKFRDIVPQSKLYSENRNEENWSKSYQLVIWKHDTLRNLLEQIRPHLTVKAEKAELLVDFIETRKSSERERSESGKFISSENPEEERIYEKFRHL